MPELEIMPGQHPVTETPTERYRSRIFTAVVIAVGVIALLLFIFNTAQVLLLLFIALLIALALRTSSHWLHTHTPLPESIALFVVIVGVTLLIILAFYLIGPRLVNQLDQLIQQLPTSLSQIEEQLREYRWGQWFMTQIPQTPDLDDILSQDGTNVFSQITGIFSTSIGVLGNLILLLFTALFFAVEPQTYMNGIAQLVPPGQRVRAKEVMLAMGDTLAMWLLSRIISMIALTILTTIGLIVIGMPLTLSLGLIAGVMAFIPMIGPIIALIPALLIGFLQSPQTALWVLLLYLVVQGIDNYILAPLVIKRTMHMPPALVIFAQLVLGVLFGQSGLILAAPLAAAGMTFVQMVYVEDFLERQGSND